MTKSASKSKSGVNPAPAESGTGQALPHRHQDPARTGTQTHHGWRGYRGLPGRPGYGHRAAETKPWPPNWSVSCATSVTTLWPVGSTPDTVAAEFLVHANEEQGHADLIAARIVQLKGEPDFSPEGLAMRSHAEYVEGDSLVGMIKEDLVAERIAIDSYGEMIQYIGDKDVTTRRMFRKTSWPWRKNTRMTCPTCWRV